MKSGFLALLCTVFLFACHFRDTAEQPSVSNEKMARIMADLSLADAATNGLTGYERDSLMQTYFKQVFQMHGLTQEEHEKNVRIYANDMDKMKALLDQEEALLSQDSAKW